MEMIEMEVEEQLEHVRELRVGDIVQTPNGPGTYQGRWWENDEITHIIIKHTLNNCADENLVDIALQLGENWVIVYYPIAQVVML